MKKTNSGTYFTLKHLSSSVSRFCQQLSCLCSFFSRTGWFGTVVEYGAERKISRHSVLSATVSVGVPQGVTLKIKYWPTQNLILISRFSSHILTLLCFYIHAGVSMQVSPCQSNVFVSSPPNGPASAQCCLLCHCGTLAGLHGDPQADHHPIYSCAERRVSTPAVLIACLF